MADEKPKAQGPITTAAVEALLARLPREEDEPELMTRRVKLTTAEGRTVYAFLRAGEGTTGFAGWEARVDLHEGEEPQMDYFICDSERPDTPLYVINRAGPLGVLASAELEERPAAA